jgi:hypothetical protein
VFIYLIMGSLDFYFYKLINSNDTSHTNNGQRTNFDFLIFYIFSCEFIFLLIKLIGKFMKLTVDLTQINMKKQWTHRLVVFNLISFTKYAIKFFIEIVTYINPSDFVSTSSSSVLYQFSSSWKCSTLVGI